MFCRNISPTHPSMMPAGIPPIRGVSGAGARVPLRGPMGRGEYGECFQINLSRRLFVSFEKFIEAIISSVFLSKLVHISKIILPYFFIIEIHLLRNTMKLVTNFACDTFYKTFIFVYNTRLVSCFYIRSIFYIVCKIEMNSFTTNHNFTNFHNTFSGSDCYKILSFYLFNILVCFFVNNFFIIIIFSSIFIFFFVIQDQPACKNFILQILCT